MENFGNIKDTFEKIIIESVITKDEKGKKLFSKYIKMVKEDKNLKNQFLIYKNLQNTKFTNETDAKDFIKENIELLKSLNTTDSNNKLVSLLKGKSIVKVNEELYKHIDFLVKTKKTPSNINRISESINFIKDNMLKVEEETITENIEVIDLPPSVLTKLAVNKLNSKYSDINESEKEIIKSILNGTDEDKSNTFKKIKNECITIINTKLTESSDLDLKDKLLRVKDKLLNMEFDITTYQTDINKVYNLKESVSSN
jgi:hypothetical protein